MFSQGGAKDLKGLDLRFGAGSDSCPPHRHNPKKEKKKKRRSQNTDTQPTQMNAQLERL